MGVQEWPVRPARRPIGFRQGRVLEAVTDVLRLAQKPMRARDVRAAVEVGYSDPRVYGE